MVLIISRISVAQAATIINSVISFAHFTLSLSLVALLFFFIPKANSALSWSSITRTLHSSTWPFILRTDSNSTEASGTSVSTISRLTMITTILFAIASSIMPLGLSGGPLVPSTSQPISAKYIPDGSPLALATSPNRHNFQYGRICGALSSVPCPGNGGNPNITAYAPSIISTFNSTPHSPFSMQYRRFFNGGISNSSDGLLGTPQSLIQRDDAFAIEGLIVDMSLDHPGIGFWNHTVPNVTDGGSWTQDVLWLEPVTECVNTNLTLDYFLVNGPDLSINTYNITDHGGFFGLTHDNPPLNRDGQNIDLKQHAFKGAVVSNFFALQFLNTTRESSFNGRAYPLNDDISTGLNGLSVNKIIPLPLSYLNSSVRADSEVVCKGFGGQDIANVTNVQVACGVILGPPLRTDSGDPRVLDSGSRWSQGIHVCASTTRASVQIVNFSINDTSYLQNLQVTRQLTKLPVLWGVERVDMAIADIDLMWGRVDDRFENDTSLWTFRSTSLNLPAGSFGLSGASFPAGQPLTAHEVVWARIYDSIQPSNTLGDYTGSSDYAMKAKFRSIIERNPAKGPAQIRNAIWTDIMANSVIGTQSSPTLLVARNQKSIEYDFRFAIPGFILLVIWAPAVIGAIILFATRMLTFGYMRKVLNHTSVGRVVVGSSALRAEDRSEFRLSDISVPEADGYGASFVDLRSEGKASGHRREKSDWAGTSGSTRVILELDLKDSFSDDAKLVP